MYVVVWKHWWALDMVAKFGGEKQEYVLNLHYQGFSVEEIQKRLKVTRNSLYILLHRARSMFKACLDKKGVTA